MAGQDAVESRAPRWFDPHISLGNVLTIIGMAAGLTGLFIKSNGTDVQHEQRLYYVETRLEKVEAAAVANQKDVLLKLESISGQVTDVRLLIAAQSGTVPIRSDRIRPARAEAHEAGEP